MHDHRRVGGDRRQDVGDRNRIQRHCDPFRQTVIAHHLFRQVAADAHDFAGQAIRKAAGEQTGVERRHGLALGLENVPDPLAQRGQVRRRPATGFGFMTVGVHQNHDALGRIGDGG